MQGLILDFIFLNDTLKFYFVSKEVLPLNLIEVGKEESLQDFGKLLIFYHFN